MPHNYDIQHPRSKKSLFLLCYYLISFGKIKIREDRLEKEAVPPPNLLGCISTIDSYIFSLPFFYY
jgi:hypothetical protein